MNKTTLKIKTWKTMDYKVSCTSHARNLVYTNLFNVVDSNDFDVSTQCITYVMGYEVTLCPFTFSSMR